MRSKKHSVPHLDNVGEFLGHTDAALPSNHLNVPSKQNANGEGGGTFESMASLTHADLLTTSNDRVLTFGTVDGNDFIDHMVIRPSLADKSLGIASTLHRSSMTAGSPGMDWSDFYGAAGDTDNSTNGSGFPGQEILLRGTKVDYFGRIDTFQARPSPRRIPNGDTHDAGRLFEALRINQMAFAGQQPQSNLSKLTEPRDAGFTRRFPPFAFYSALDWWYWKCCR